MKYRVLSKEELQELRPEFINFLASNGVTAEDYKNLLERSPEKAEELINIFSDIVLDKVLKKIQFVDYREAKSVMIFNFKEETIFLVGLTIQGDSDIDLTVPECIEQLSKGTLFLANEKVEVFKTEKKYLKPREEEIFNLIETGGMVSDGKLFEVLSNLK